MMIRTQFPDLFLATMLPALDEVIFDKYDRFPPQYSRVFRVMDSHRSIEQTTQLSGLTLHATIAEGAPVRYDEPVLGFNKTYQHSQLGLGFRASRVMVDDDKFSIIKKMASDLGRSGKETVEILAASVFNNGFNAAYPGPDGVALFSASHPLVKSGGTQGNCTSVATDLDVISLQLALTAFRQTVDSSGRKVRIQPAKLIVPATLEWVAAEILSGPKRADTANNTVNAFQFRDGFGPFRDYMVWDYLTAPHAWFLAAEPEDTELRYYWRERPNTIHDIDFDSRSIKTAMWERFSYGWSDFYGFYGSQ